MVQRQKKCYAFWSVGGNTLWLGCSPDGPNLMSGRKQWAVTRGPSPTSSNSVVGQRKVIQIHLPSSPLPLANSFHLCRMRRIQRLQSDFLLFLPLLRMSRYVTPPVLSSAASLRVSFTTSMMRCNRTMTCRLMMHSEIASHER